jgi:hypothetical protein
MKHTHKAHCQACGRIQALDNDSKRIAKHGYLVSGFGYFHGTCLGSDRSPLETHRDYADQIVTVMISEEARLVNLASEVAAGKRSPTKATTGRHVRNEQGRWVTEEIAFADADKYYQDLAREMLVRSLHNESRQAKDHGKFIADLIVSVHGQELISVERKAKTATLVVPGATVRLHGKDGFDAVVIRIETRTVFGCGPNLNGQRLPHAIYERNGKEWGYPVRLIRNVK